MGLVKENIDFKRGMDSRKALKVGKTHIKEQNKNWRVMMDNLKEEFDLYEVRDWSNISIYATKLKKKWTEEEIQKVENWMYHNTYFIVTRAKTNKKPGREYAGRLTWELMLRVRDTRERDYNQRKQDYINKKKIGESIEFKRTGDSKSGLGVGRARYRENIDKLVQDLQQSIREIEGGEGFFKATVRKKPENPWGYQNLGNYPKYVNLTLRSRIFNPRPVDHGIFKSNVREWIKKNTDFKIHQFTRDRSRGGLDNYNLLLK